MGRNILVVVIAAVLCTGIVWADPVTETVTHRRFQAVNASGESTYTNNDKVILEGIVLNMPGNFLDPTGDDSITEMYNISGQWQIFFQGQGEDHAGTAVWMGQLYNNLPWVSPDGGYTNTEWAAEMIRINAGGFGPGDRIRVTGYFLSYKGKTNVNEQHNNNPDHDITINVLERGVGLPRPEIVSLEELKDELDEFIFDPRREYGSEYYQGRLVKIENVWFVDMSVWGPNAQMLITDGVRTFPLILGRGTGIYAGSNNLARSFDVIGIMDQESTDLTAGYLLRVLDYDGNGSVLASREHRRAGKPGDFNLDGAVNFTDLAKLAEDWLK